MEQPPITEKSGKIVKLFSKRINQFIILSTKTTIPKFIYNLKHTVKDTIQKTIVIQPDCDYIILQFLDDELTDNEIHNRIIYWKYQNLELIGLDAELRNKDLFGTVFGSKIEKSKFKFTTIDFFLLCIQFVIELKHRQCKHNQYPTAFINLCKIEKALSKNIIFIFEYDDGLYYIQYEKVLFDKFEIDYDRQFGNSRPQNVINIPTRFLTKLNPLEKITLIKHYPADDANFYKWIEKDKYMYNISK